MAVAHDVAMKTLLVCGYEYGILVLFYCPQLFGGQCLNPPPQEKRAPHNFVTMTQCIPPTQITNNSIWGMFKPTLLSNTMHTYVVFSQGVFCVLCMQEIKMRLWEPFRAASVFVSW